MSSMSTDAEKIVLIVEDDEVILRALYLALHEEHFTIATATDGESGLTMTQRMKPDLVLLDLIMPKMDGFTYLKYLKADPKIAKTPVIVLSNLGDQESIQKAKDLGAADYFVKSDTDLSDLSKKVRKFLKQ